MSQASWPTLFAYCWCNERFKFLKKLKDNFLHLLINKRFGQRLKSVNITDTPTIMTSQCQRITPFLLHHHHQQAAGGEVAVVAPLAMWGTENGTAHAQLVLYGCTYIHNTYFWRLKGIQSSEMLFTTSPFEREANLSPCEFQIPI